MQISMKFYLQKNFQFYETFTDLLTLFDCYGFMLFVIHFAYHIKSGSGKCGATQCIQIVKRLPCKSPGY